MNYISGQLAEPALPAVWLALMTAVDTDAGTGGTEVSGGSYARVQVAGTATTNATTASGNATLHFAATPAWIVAGMTVYDVTSPSVIPAATTVLSVTGTTVVMSANASGAGVGGTDVIAFSAFSAATGSAPSQITNNAVITFAQATASWGTVIAFELRDAVTSGNLLAWDYIGNFSGRRQPCPPPRRASSRRTRTATATATRSCSQLSTAARRRRSLPATIPDCRRLRAPRRLVQCDR